MILEASKVTQRVEAALKEDETTRPYAIEVIDQDGVVTLKGEVPSAEIKTRAESLAAEQEGVVDVTNALVVTSEEEGVEDAKIITSPTQATGSGPSTLYTTK
jgi:osmotically-inducible protein OsmY